MSALSLKNEIGSFNPAESLINPYLSVAAEPTRVEKFNLQEVKNTVDDHLKLVLDKGYGWSESHVHTDLKLALGIMSCLVAGAAALYNYKVPFEKCRMELIAAVCAYGFISAILGAYVFFVEKNAVFTGYKKTGKGKQSKVVAVTTLKNYNPNYSIDLFISTKHKHVQKKSFSYCIDRWFDVDGTFVGGAFCDDIETVVSAAKMNVLED